MHKNERIEELKKMAKKKQKEAKLLLEISRGIQEESLLILENAKAIAKEEAEKEKKEKEHAKIIAKEEKEEVVVEVEEVEEVEEEYITVFKKKVDEKIGAKRRSNKFVVMSCKQIPRLIIDEYLCQKWDILAEYLDPEENSEPWKYTFTKPFSAQKGEYLKKEYTSIFEE